MAARDGRAGQWLTVVALALLALAWAVPADAAVSYGQGSGLPGLLVHSLARDERGFLWVGTQDGVARFDSHRFQAIELSHGQPIPDLQTNRLLAVPGAVYIATPSRLQRFDLASESVRTVQFQGDDVADVRGLALAGDGSVFAVSERGRVYRWRDRGGMPELQELPVQSAQPLPGVKNMAVGRDALWLATAEGVWRIDRQSWVAERLRLDLAQLKHGAVHVSAVLEARDGELWIGLWNDGLLRYRPSDGSTQWITPGSPAAGALRSTSIYSFLETADGMLIGSNRGMVNYRRDCQCLRGLNHPKWDEVDGSGFIVSAIVADDDGIWAGIWGAGLVRFSQSDQVIEHQVRVDHRDDSLAHPMVYALQPGQDGRLWIGTYGGGVQWSDPAQRRPGETWPLHSLPWGERRIESKFIWALQDSAEQLLIGSGHGLLAWRGDALQDLAPELLSVRCLLRLDPQRQLVGSMFGLFVEQDGNYRQVALDGSGELGGAAQAIWSLSRRGDEIWVGSARGLWRLRDDLSLIRHHPVGGADDRLPGPVVWTQKADTSGQLWLGSSGGLVEVAGSPGEPRFVRHPAPGTLGVSSVVSIEFDRSGQLWLGTPKGLLRYRPTTGAVRLYDSQDGLVSDQLNSNASANDGERLYFGGIGGLVAFDPLAMPDEQSRLSPRVVKLRLGRGRWQPAQAQLRLPHNHPNLHVELSAFHFSRPERVRYSYRWLPMESTFTELGDARSAVFSRLPSGVHRLQLRASLDNDPASARIADGMTVIVAAAWHETLWGRALVVLAVVALGWAVYALRSRQARRYAQGLARDVRQRTHELTAAKEALEAANRQLQRQAWLDPLTGLENRRRLFHLAEGWRASGKPLAAMLIDLDHFKRINDQHGHHAGDAVLIDFAAIMRDTFGDRAVCARYGGEEFLALIDNDDDIDLAELAQRLLAQVRVRQVNNRDSGDLRYTASVGVACAQPGESFESLVRRADRALYRAKDLGRDQAVLL